jgi:polysaccharide pyruvyl transferase WcaK-like protein
MDMRFRVARMIIEVRGGGFVNKGAELMLVAAVEGIRRFQPNARIAVDYRQGTVDGRRKMGLHDLYWREHEGGSGAALAYNMVVRALKRLPGEHVGSGSVLNTGRLLPSRLRKVLAGMSGVRSKEAVSGSDVDLVFDISGFAYGDAWGLAPISRAVERYRQVRERGGHVVLLPQQFGPFRDPAMRARFRELVRQCDLIFARDPASFEAVAELSVDAAIQLAPDFTGRVQSRPPAESGLRNRVLIVPNAQMVRQGWAAQSAKKYITFLCEAVEGVRACGEEPVFLIHEYFGGDEGLAEIIAQRTGVAEIVREQDPLCLKGIIGVSSLVIGSRYHSLMSALSQGVPAIATGWSHKYKYLFREYGCEDRLLATENTQRLRMQIAELLEPHGNVCARISIRRRSSEVERGVSEMWSRIQRAMACW